MSRDPEYQADCTKTVLFQWENGAMSDEEALERIRKLYERYEVRRRG